MDSAVEPQIDEDRDDAHHRAGDVEPSHYRFHMKYLLSIHASASADCSWFDLVDSVDWLEELDHELVEAHAEHSGGFLELFGSE